MKIAIVTNDQENISQHFGRSRYYYVLDINESGIQNTEVVERKTGHFAPGAGHQNQGRHHHSRDHSHGSGPHAAEKHTAMIDEMRDCDIIISGGMGPGANPNPGRSERQRRIIMIHIYKK